MPGNEPLFINVGLNDLNESNENKFEAKTRFKHFSRGESASRTC